MCTMYCIWLFTVPTQSRDATAKWAHWRRWWDVVGTQPGAAPSLDTHLRLCRARHQVIGQGRLSRLIRFCAQRTLLIQNDAHYRRRQWRAIGCTDRNVSTMLVFVFIVMNFSAPIPLAIIDSTWGSILVSKLIFCDAMANQREKANGFWSSQILRHCA